MPQIRTGTVDVTNGSQTVTGIGTAWLNDEFDFVSVNDLFMVVGDDEVLYTVAAVISDTELTLASNYAGDTNVNVEYLIVRDFTPHRNYPLPHPGDIQTSTISRKAWTMLDALHVGTSFPSDAAIGDWFALGTGDPLTYTIYFWDGNTWSTVSVAAALAAQEAAELAQSLAEDAQVAAELAETNAAASAAAAGISESNAQGHETAAEGIANAAAASADEAEDSATAAAASAITAEGHADDAEASAIAAAASAAEIDLPADPAADSYLFWNDSTNEMEWSTEIADSFLSSNVPLLDATETITGDWSFDGAFEVGALFNITQGTVSANSSDGFFRIAENSAAAGRGGCEIWVSNGGGNGAPTATHMSVSTGFGAVAPSVTILSHDHLGSGIDVRPGYDSTTTRKYIDIQVDHALDATYHVVVKSFNFSGTGWFANVTTEPDPATPSATYTTPVNTVFGVFSDSGNNLHFNGSTGLLTVDGDVDITGVNQSISNATPHFYLNETDAGTNEKIWLMESLAGTLRIGATTADADPSNTVNTAITLTRTGTTIDEIALNATLIDINGTVDVSGNVSGASILATGLLRTTSTTPRIDWRETDAATDEEWWIAQSISGNWQLRAYDDVISGSNAAVLITRTGITIDEIQLNATLVDINGNVDISGSITGAGSLADSFLSANVALYNASVASFSTGVFAAARIAGTTHGHSAVNALVQFNRLSSTDLDTYLTAGVYGLGSGHTNAPTGLTFDPMLVTQSSTDVGSQLVLPRSANRPLTYRGWSSGGTFTDWQYALWGTSPDDGSRLTFSGADTPPAALHSALTQNMLFIDGKETIDGNDVFLRLNQNGEFTSGIYTPGALRCDGTFNVRDSITLSSAEAGSQIHALDANTFTAPAYSFVSDTNSGMYSQSNDILAFSTAGAKRAHFINPTATGRTSSLSLFDHGANVRDAGFNKLLQFNVNVSDTLEAEHSGTVQIKTTTTARTLTLAASTDLDFPVNAITDVWNLGTSGNYTITEGAGTLLYYVEPGTGRVDTAGGCTIGPGGVASIWRQQATIYYIFGSEITP